MVLARNNSKDIMHMKASEKPTCARSFRRRGGGGD